MKKRFFISAVSVLTACTLLAGCGCGERQVSTVNDPKTSSVVKTENGNTGGIYTEEAYSAAEAADGGAMCPITPDHPAFNTEEYKDVDEHGFRSVLTSPLSTFAADVDTASYSNIRRMILDGYTIDEIPSGAVRAEEMINYFDYDYEGPKKGEPFGVNFEVSTCPWNTYHYLLKIGLATEAIDYEDAPDMNLVFLLDVSGSMNDYNKLPLLKSAFSTLVDQLDENDTVSIVTYAGSDEVVLEGASGGSKRKIMRAINRLEAEGSTNGGEGIITAYELAEKYFIEGGNNRVILATDGDLNVGVTSESELHDLITEKKESGVFLSVLGFGTGNYSDTNLETLADDGNGNYSYIDSDREAYKVLSKEFTANMITVAKDVKLQVEFNPAYVSSYRQIGYENREMAAEDFDDDTKDGGEIGAGHTVTVLYELVPAGSEEDEDGSRDLKYQTNTVNRNAGDSGEWAALSIRYKDPESDDSELLEYAVTDDDLSDIPSDDFRFAACVAEFAMVLSDSEYLSTGTILDVLKELKSLDPDDEYKQEFHDLVIYVTNNEGLPDLDGNYDFVE